MRINKPHIQKILTETVLTLCQTGIPFDAELSIEGLLGITLDKDNIILVNIKEVIRHDVPKDYSKKSEKRKADIESDGMVKRQKEGASKRGHSFIPEGYHSPEDGQCNNNMNGNGSGSNSLKIPLIPPEFVRDVQAASHQIRQKHVTDVRQKHSEISRMLAVAQMQAAENPKSEAMSYSPAPEMIPLPEAAHSKNESRPQSAVNLEQEYISPRPASQGNSFCGRPTENMSFEQSFERPPSNRSPLFPTDLSMHTAPRQRPFPSPVFPGPEPISHSMISPSFGQQNTNGLIQTSQPIGVVLDTNVQPPAPLAVVAGTGVLQPVSSMQRQNQLEHDFLKNLPEGTAIVQPVEIVPEMDIRKMKGGPMGSHLGAKKKVVKKERSQMSPNSLSNSKTDKMGRPKKSKEFCRFRCTMCNAASSRKFNLQRHVNSHHPNATNCIIDLTPPKNPRQVRPKGSPADLKFHIPEGAMYGMGTPEGVTIENAMDLSVSPSSEYIMFPGAEKDDDVMSNISSKTDDFTPPESVQSVAGTGYSTPVNDVNRTTPQSVSPIPNSTGSLPMPVAFKSDVLATSDVKKRFAKGKKSLDNMLFNKFGMYHNFSDTAKSDEGKEEENENHTKNMKDEDNTLNAPKDNEEAQIDDEADEEVNAFMEAADDADNNDDVGESGALDEDDDDVTDDEDNALIIETGEKVEQQNVEKHVSDDVELLLGTGDQESANSQSAKSTVNIPSFESQNSGSTATMELDEQESEINEGESNNDSENKQNGEEINVLPLELDLSSAPRDTGTNKRQSDASDASIETDANANNKSDMSFKHASLSPADVNGNSKSTKPINCEAAGSLPVTCELSSTSSTINTGPKNKLESEIVDENFANDEVLKTCDETIEETAIEESEVDIKNKIGPVPVKDNGKDMVRLTRRSQSNTTGTEDNVDSSSMAKGVVSSSSPRKTQGAKAAIREPIKTRTSTRASSITTRRSSARDENELK